MIHVLLKIKLIRNFSITEILMAVLKKKLFGIFLVSNSSSYITDLDFVIDGVNENFKI